MISTKLKKVVGSLASVVILSLAGGIQASESSYSPAMFDFSGTELAKKLGSLLTSSSEAVVYCQSNIDTHGAVNLSRCYDPSSNFALVRSLEKALSSLSFTPAQVDGKTVPVRVSYRVALSKTGVELIPNLGTMESRYGRSYTAPQERLDVSDWYAKYSDDSWVDGDAFLGTGDLSRVAATVDKKGKPSVVRTVESKRGYKRDATIIRSALKRSRFIPGFVDGEPVAMGYLAVVNYGNQGEEVTSR